MTFALPNPTIPANGQSLNATPILQNFIAIQQAIAAFDGSQINAGSIVAAALNANINPNTLLNETTEPFVASGIIWSIVTGLQITSTSGIIYYNGIRVPVNSIATDTLTASKDTYIDVDVNGNITYNAVTNNASAPSITANSIRVAKIVSGASSISSIIQTGIDSNNVQIYPTSPQGFGNWISYTPTFANFTLGNGTVVAAYTKIGKTIHSRGIITLGSTSSMGSSPTISLPVASSSNIYNAGSLEIIGQGSYLRAAIAFFQMIYVWVSTTTMTVQALTATNSYVNPSSVSSTVPATWASTDTLVWDITYEAA